MSSTGAPVVSYRRWAPKQRRVAMLLSGGVLAVMASNPAFGQAVDALPTGGAVVAGSATISSPGAAQMGITQSSDRAVIEWDTFDIGQNAEVAFSQPNSSSIALNRVIGGAAPSRIAGKLTANGIVGVLNANGVIFAGTADVDVGGLIASTGRIDNAAFMAGGNLNITDALGGEIVVTAGANITVADAGLAALVAPTVRNSGTITATAGRVQLGAGTAFTLDLAGDGLLEIGVGSNSALVENHGSLFANGGRIQLSARQASAALDQTINTGVLPVGSARLDGNTIVLEAIGQNFTVASEIAGRGNLIVSGNRISGAADLNVDGALTLNVNAGGQVADTLATGNNWINDALAVIGSQVDSTTINLGAGLYRPGVRIDASNVIIDGQNAARVGWVSGTDNAVDVWGDNVTVRNLEIFGPATSGFTTYAWGAVNSRGIFVNRNADNVTLTGNNIHDIRTGVIVDGRNVNTTVTGNRIDNTKSAISVQYTDGSAITLSDNTQGAFGNEWGINVYLNGILQPDGTTILPSTSSASGLPVGVLGVAGLPEQQRLLALMNANGGMAVQNLAYSGANRTRSYVAVGAPTNTQGSALNPLGTIQAGIDAVVTGGTVNVANGTYNIGNTPILIKRGLSLIGASESGVIIDGRGVGSGLGTLQVQADNVSLSHFTLYGADSGANNYGVKVQPSSSVSYSPNQRVYNFAVSDVTVRGSTRAELDLNGVIGATITRFTADGRRVSDASFQSGGAGVQITDSADVTLTGVHTIGNAWGGVALYQANKAGGYNGQTTNISINAAQNTFEEPLGLFTQRESATQDFGQLNLTGFNYAVRNSDHRPDNLDSQFTFFRTTLSDASAFANAVGVAGASSIEGYTGTAFSNVFHVTDGLSINTALRDVRAGGTVNVAAGTYAETVSIGKSITLDGAGKNLTSIIGGLLLSGTLSNLVLSDFAVSGAGGSGVISNSATITGLTLDGVRIDGQSVADRHGFVGGRVHGAISITNSEFLNIRGWSAFDTRSGAGTNQGADITSGVFSNNLIDNTIGHIAFRQDSASAFPNIVFDNNTARNIGNATNSFGAIFKAFNAANVDFTNNNISGIGTSGSNPSGEAPYGAALMVRGAALLNVIGNTFTGNNQVFAVEAGRSLPTVTNFTGNTFINNGYSIYLPTNLSGAGTISFGAGNNFVAGDNTVRHIVWRSTSGLDLTGVSFGGKLGTAMNLSELFAAEDLITHGIDQSGFGLARVLSGNLFVTTGSGTDAALRALTIGSNGDRLNLSAGTHTLTNTLFLTKDIDVVGQGRAVTILNASGHNNYGIRVHSNNVALSGFTLNGSAGVTNSTYGIKVEATGGPTDRNTGFAITNVDITGSRKTGLDLNSVAGATIDGVNVSGVIAGNGISITDSSNVVVRNSSTSGNAWGGLALYQANNIAGGGSNQQLTNVTVEASNNFAERTGVYLQASSELMAPGTISVQGYDYTIRNADHRVGGNEFTFFQKTAQNAYDYAVNLAAPGSSVVQGWAGSANDSNFYVGLGALLSGGQSALSLQAAFNGSSNGDTINVASGTYAQNATLSGTRTLNFGTVVINGLTLSSTAPGNSLRGDITLNSGNFVASGPLTLTGATRIAASGNLTLGAVSGTQALTLAGGAVSFGAADLASLTASGSSIATRGVTTTGAQSYTGPVSLQGSYAGSALTVTGSSTLIGATTIATTGNLTLGAVSGAQSLTLAGGAVSLGAADLASLTASGGSIATRGVTTTGAQSYTGPVSLQGSYGGSALTVTGASTLTGATTIATTGNLTLGAVSGAQALTLAGGAVSLGAADLASLTASGSSIATRGVTTTGAQSYTGPVSLQGSYGGSALTVTGTSTLTGATTIATSGNLTLGAVSGAQALTLAGGAVSLGAADLASLTASGSSIATRGVATTGAQSYTGAVSLQGSYAGSALTVSGSSTLIGATTIATTGNLTLGAVSGAQALTLAGGAVSLGAADLASLTASGSSIATRGVTTTGAQSYTGPVSLQGSYAASSFTVSGAATLSGNSDIAARGAVQLGAVDALTASTQTLALTAQSATLGSIGQATRLGSIRVTADGVVLTGEAYRAGSITFTGGAGATVRLTRSKTSFDTSPAGGPITLLSHLIGTVNGEQNVAFITGSGSAIVLGNLGTNDIRLRDLEVTGGDFSAATVKLSGDFTSLLGGSQIFSSQTLDTLGNVNASVAGSESGPIVAGGSVILAAGGSGTGSITAGGAVNLAYSSAVSREISSQSTVSLAAVGPVTGSIAATGPVAITATGPVSAAVNTSGSANIASVAGVSSNVSAGGSVSLTASQGSVSSAVTSGGTVNVNAVGPVTGSISATGPVAVTATGPVSTSVNTAGSVNLSSVSGISSNVTAGQGVQVSSSQGAVSGSINAGGGVAVNASGAVSVAVSTTGSANLVSSSGGVSSAIQAGGAVSVAAPGAVTSNISSGGAVNLTSSTPLQVHVDGGSVTVNAPGGQVSGQFAAIKTGEGGSFVVNDQPVIGGGHADARQIIVDTFLAPVGGAVGSGGEILLPQGLSLALIAPAGGPVGGTVTVNSVQRLGELLRLGYTAIIVDIEDGTGDRERAEAGSAS